MGESQDSSYSRSNIQFCDCGVSTPIQTSWSKENPGRRFVGSGRYTPSFKCKTFEWIDPEQFGKRRQPGLYEKIKLLERSNCGLEEQNMQLMEENRFLKMEIMQRPQTMEELEVMEKKGMTEKCSCRFCALIVVGLVLVLVVGMLLCSVE